MTAEILTFPSKARPKLVVPTSDRVVRLWAEMEARRIAFSMNPLPHNKAMFDSAQRRYDEACTKAGWPD